MKKAFVISVIVSALLLGTGLGGYCFVGYWRGLPVAELQEPFLLAENFPLNIRRVDPLCLARLNALVEKLLPSCKAFCYLTEDRRLQLLLVRPNAYAVSKGDGIKLRQLVWAELSRMAVEQEREALKEKLQVDAQQQRFAEQQEQIRTLEARLQAAEASAKDKAALEPPAAPASE